jgi:hypothetical protein
MRTKIQVKFYGQEGDLVREAAKSVNLSVEEFVRHCALSLIINANERAKQQKEIEDAKVSE